MVINFESFFLLFLHFLLILLIDLLLWDLLGFRCLTSRLDLRGFLAFFFGQRNAIGDRKSSRTRGSLAVILLENGLRVLSALCRIRGSLMRIVLSLSSAHILKCLFSL